MSKHTQGPWMVEGRTVYALNEDGYNRFSALVQDAHTPGNELEANARLIAAAPELLEALQSAISAFEEIQGGSATDRLICLGESGRARAAIAKALGEE